MRNQKVYVIDPPKATVHKPATAEAAAARTAARPSPNRDLPRQESWLLALRAYALGPLNLVLWPSGALRFAWAIFGALSIVATVTLWIWWRPFARAARWGEASSVVWAVSVAAVVLLLVTAWARAVATCDHGSWPRLFRRPAVAGALGFLLPGAGLLIARRPRMSAAAIWFAGLFVASIMITARWLSSGTVVDGESAGVVNWAFEWAFAGALACAVLGGFVWLAQALEGARVHTTDTRSGARANRLALALLAAVIVFLATLSPTDLASNLESAAMLMRERGLRVVPIALYETASKLDPATPTYLAGAVELYDDIGRTEAANSRRALIRERADRFADALDAVLVPATAEATATHRTETADGFYYWLPQIGPSPRRPVDEFPR